MSQNNFSKIASSNYLRVLWDVIVDKNNEHISYVKCGVRVCAGSEKYDRLFNLLRGGSKENRYAISYRMDATGKYFVVIDRAFFDEF